MPEIVPAIIAKNFDDLQAKIKLVEPYVKTVQLDVMDGIFVPKKTWPFDLAQGKPSVSELDDLKTTLFLEAHLMIDNPHRVFNDWLVSPVARIILHWEAVEKIHAHELSPYETSVDNQFPISNLAREAHRCGKELGLALNPQTPITVLDNFIKELDLVLLMSVEPGAAGQDFQGEVIHKIQALRQKYPDVKIEIDGGVSAANISLLKESKVDYLAVGSVVFEAVDIKQTLLDLEKLII